MKKIRPSLLTESQEMMDCESLEVALIDFRGCQKRYGEASGLVPGLQRVHHHHKALKMMSPREFREHQIKLKQCQGEYQ
jgi:hypothetical protein